MLIELMSDMQLLEQLGDPVCIIEFAREILQKIFDNLISCQRQRAMLPVGSRLIHRFDQLE